MNTQDKTTVHIVVIFLGLIALSLAGGMLWLNSNGQHIDPVLSTVAATALGALTALLVSTKTSQDPTPDPIVDVPAGKHSADSAPVGADLTVNDLTTPEV